ncbi:flagellar motor switch protein FliG [Leptospira sp. 2 VSF19]|uniref:Flagellar motor switch protein FliG n=1 Tax=Leptospira soteropolitanensis TaxID=2950025 RepID=A0AAW5VHU2_9LEPT|nr:FliG C-terminal domain-containing protein [Leptospira soteropolitanensis]MCW7492934.1 flagellar motor switch protein FliG [Leptospira soteropolitanensis]MCW7500169.1 flagellar motor switch protein FliG [Leptospira soteropolitanensis]MCW7522420.1 flagellar motor switch protein FliG [Leptospira soteropolitanensis]MCW7526276.1 flagellar motor switch protein FliG [Leptospira soteropolitanensis]MCW7529612.1 flagellar motor switch protein FliG [Leptospira soteropolitanensis]
MIYRQGNNYHFFLANADSVARFQSSIHPFYPIPQKKIPELPSVTSDPILFPQFLYDLHYNRQNFISKPVITPNYIGSIKVPSDKETKPKPGFFPLNTSIGGIRNTPFPLYRGKRDKFQSAKYLSLRDIIHPELSEDLVRGKIESLYFDAESKTYLFRLVSILFSGTPKEEEIIVSNLFRHEPEFAQFLTKQMFTVEMLPLIHGNFLQEILRDHDERSIKYILPSLSKPVWEVVRTSISKNKMKQILNGPTKKPEEGEDLISVIETELFKRFARNIYYEEGSIFTYKETGEVEKKDEIPFAKAEKFNFFIDGNFLLFYGRTTTKLFFKTENWIECLRFDFFLSRKEIETFQFHRLPPDLIIEIPYYPTGIFLVGGGITKERKPFEFSLLWFDY